jgi:hypothetical protein
VGAHQKGPKGSAAIGSIDPGTSIKDQETAMLGFFKTSLS